MKSLSHLLAQVLPNDMLSTSVDIRPDLTVSGFALDNRRIKPGMVFVALQGTQQHGLIYAEAAVAAGAVAVLYEPVLNENVNDVGLAPADVAATDAGTPGANGTSCNVPMIAVEGLAAKLGQLASAFYDHPTQAIDVIGVTGTDGKTSVTHFIAEAMQALNRQAAVIGTIGIGRPGDLQSATHTTPDAISTHAHLRALSDSGVKSVAMEVSSHALDQGRVGGVDFSIAVLTNLTRDHLDYHGTVQAYADAKRRLFHWSGLQGVVLNLDDAFGVELANELLTTGAQGATGDVGDVATGDSAIDHVAPHCAVLGYGVGQPADYPAHTIVATDAVFDHSGIRAQITSPWGMGELYASVLGRFNLDNLLATLGVLLLQGHALGDALAALAQVHTVPGRMERISFAPQSQSLLSNDVLKDLLTVVDYAHTPGALTSVLSAVRGHTQRDLTCVFGCGGDRDAGKRPLMAAAAEQAADQIIVTDDNPRTEDASVIFADIRRGFAQPERVCFEHDRARAIRRAIQQAGFGDTVLIAGKGHETVQIVQQESRPFDDREQARLALQECAA